LSKRFEQRTNGLLVAAIVIAGLVAIAAMGNLTYFGRVPLSEMPEALLGNALLVAVCAGIIGGLFSRLLIESFTNSNWRINRWRAAHPLLFAGFCGLLVAILGYGSDGAAFGSGYAPTRDLLANGDAANAGYFAIKFVATWLSFWSGIPGGIFAPALSIGASIGHDIALLTHAVPPAALAALGMTSFLAAVTQAPITSFIIVMEMTDGHGFVLVLMASAFLAAAISRLFSASLYPALAVLQFERVSAALAGDRNARA
jgi:H+/Cl- antiporter ClcA